MVLKMMMAVFEQQIMVDDDDDDDDDDDRIAGQMIDARYLFCDIV